MPPASCYDSAWRLQGTSPLISNYHYPTSCHTHNLIFMLTFNPRWSPLLPTAYIDYIPGYIQCRNLPVSPSPGYYLHHLQIKKASSTQIIRYQYWDSTANPLKCCSQWLHYKFISVQLPTYSPYTQIFTLYSLISVSMLWVQLPWAHYARGSTKHANCPIQQLSTITHFPTDIFNCTRSLVIACRLPQRMHRVQSA